MWVKAQNGELVNLYRCERIEINEYPATNPTAFRVAAIANTGWLSKLAEFKRRADAEQAIANLHAWILDEGSGIGFDFSAPAGSLVSEPSPVVRMPT